MSLKLELKYDGKCLDQTIFLSSVYENLRKHESCKQLIENTELTDLEVELDLRYLEYLLECVKTCSNLQSLKIKSIYNNNLVGMGIGHILSAFNGIKINRLEIIHSDSNGISDGLKQFYNANDVNELIINPKSGSILGNAFLEIKKSANIKIDECTIVIPEQHWKKFLEHLSKYKIKLCMKMPLTNPLVKLSVSQSLLKKYYNETDDEYVKYFIENCGKFTLAKNN